MVTGRIQPPRPAPPRRQLAVHRSGDSAVSAEPLPGLVLLRGAGTARRPRTAAPDTTRVQGSLPEARGRGLAVGNVWGRGDFRGLRGLLRFGEAPTNTVLPVSPNARMLSVPSRIDPDRE